MANSAEAPAIASAMTALWQGEIPATIRVLRAVPDSGRDYRPAPRSRSAWELVTHLATSDFWFIDSIERGQFKWDPEGAARAAAAFGQVSDVVDFYEATIPSRLQRLNDLSPEELAASLDFFGNMQMPRAVWIGYATNHSIHHRGQLSTYLRAMGSKVPDIYGPSADAAA